MKQMGGYSVLHSISVALLQVILCYVFLCTPFCNVYNVETDYLHESQTYRVWLALLKVP